MPNDPDDMFFADDDGTLVITTDYSEVILTPEQVEELVTFLFDNYDISIEGA